MGEANDSKDEEHELFESEGYSHFHISFIHHLCIREQVGRSTTDIIIPLRPDLSAV